MISTDTVKHVASLARISLEEKKIEILTKDLENILAYIEKLEKLDTKGIEPTSHPLTLENVYRDDVVKDSLKQEDVLKFAVSTKNGCFKVPKVIE